MILKEKNKVGGITPPKFKTSLQSCYNRDNVEWHQDRYISQGNRIESPEANPQVYGQQIFDEGAKIIQWGKDWSFQQLVLEQLGIHM